MRRMAANKWHKGVGHQQQHDENDYCVQGVAHMHCEPMTTSKTASEQASASAGHGRMTVADRICDDLIAAQAQEIARLASSVANWRVNAEERLEFIEARDQEIARLKGIIHAYGQHRPQCIWRKAKLVVDERCDCGWKQEARAALKEQEGNNG